jgi:hypothetical protein
MTEAECAALRAIIDQVDSLCDMPYQTVHQLIEDVQLTIQPVLDDQYGLSPVVLAPPPTTDSQLTTCRAALRRIGEVIQWGHTSASALAADIQGELDAIATQPAATAQHTEIDEARSLAEE